MNNVKKITLRSIDTETTYYKSDSFGRQVDLWEKDAVYETENYKVVENEFPYDLVHEKNLMLLTKDSPDMAFKYAREFTEKFTEYDQIIWNTPANQSQNHISHIHILRLRRIPVQNIND